MYRIPEEKKIRVIVDTDAACEAAETISVDTDDGPPFDSV